ncbi:thioesterase II family protein [Gorillibacterium massiliense]|uniref:thioesterase II family protein n=1 Tax=Gorillibacterium massiliense TaxID=1280390 RepID=UPI0004BCEDB7|nr:alpha/beta fold hydrolase [Gorillibacterium massiliense]
MKTQLFKIMAQKDERRQLILFPFAGGNANSYRGLAKRIPAGWQVMAVDPPGHGANELPLIEDFDALIDLYLDEMLPLLAHEFVLFGHSMGGMTAFRLAQRLEELGRRPSAIIISGVNPPHLMRNKVAHLDDPEFLGHFQQLGGIPTELLQYKELLSLLLPILRADCRALESFRSTDGRLLTSPMTVFAGDGDRFCSIDQVKQWDLYATIPIVSYQFHGGHMFILEETEPVAECLSRILRTTVANESVIPVRK